MSDIATILEGLTGGLSLDEARRDWETALGQFLHRWEPPDALRIWQTSIQRFLDSLQAETAETILEGLFLIMQARLFIDPIIIGSDFRKNIDNFTGRYLFRSKSGDIGVRLDFEHGGMAWHESLNPEVNATLQFKDGRGLINYLFSFLVLQNRDLLSSVIHNDIKVSGNLNYLYKFLYMVNHILLEATGKLP